MAHNIIYINLRAVGNGKFRWCHIETSKRRTLVCGELGLCYNEIGVAKHSLTRLLALL